MYEDKMLSFVLQGRHKNNHLRGVVYFLCKKETKIVFQNHQSYQDRYDYNAVLLITD